MLALFNCSEDTDCGSQSTDLLPAILAERNGSVTRVPLGFMLSKIGVYSNKGQQSENRLLLFINWKTRTGDVRSWKIVCSTNSVKLSIFSKRVGDKKTFWA